MDPEDPLAQLAEGPIFVVGLPRSGTTWVGEILGLHPLVTVAYESYLFDSPTGLSEFFSQRHWGPDASGLVRFMSREAFAREVRLFTSRVLARRLYPGNRFLVEKTPGHLARLRLIAEVFPDARFIHVVRDGRDVFVSTRAGRRSWASGWSDRGFRFSLPRLALRWKRAMRNAASDAAELGDRYLEVRFEDLKADPVESSRRMFEFCRIPHDTDILRQITEVADFDRSHVADESAFFRGGRVGDWRTHLNVIEGLLFNVFAGDALVEKGYEPNRRWRASWFRKVRPPSRFRARANRSRPGGSPAGSSGASDAEEKTSA